MMHKKTNGQKITGIAFVAMVFALVTSSLAHAADYQLQQQIVDPSSPVDVCPNIPGVQTTIPSGMQLDGSGNCYTPTPPPTPPVTTDLCNNISGVQTTLPAGYYRTSGGNCYAQPAAPTTPVDVCPNIEDIQAVVPDGQYLNADGNCYTIPQPVDMCPNIDGPQETVPDGMVLENETCFTPSTTNNNGGNTEQPATTTKKIKNVPDFLQPVVQPLVNLVPEQTQEWLKSLPEQVAQSVPYYIFVIVGIVGIIPILQAVREAIFVRQLLVLLKRERDIAEQKDNFISLASHYLRTPLTLMKSGLDTIVALQELPPETVQPVRLQLDTLDTSISTILNDIEQNSALKNIQGPVGQTTLPPAWRSGWFWGPIVSSLVLTAIANFLLVIVGEKDFSMTTTFFQFLVAAVSFFVLYLGVRNLHLQRQLRVENQALIDHEKTIDDARNAFITRTTSALQNGLGPISQAGNAIAAAPSSKYFYEGYGRIEGILEKFLLLSHIQAGAERNLETFDLHETINQALVSYQDAISAKRITVTNNTPSVAIQQDRLLFNFVLGSLLDNAIKFNQDGGTIEIGAQPDYKTLTIRIADNGIGIDVEKIGQLFKPFSRATSTVEFNYEGLGFSLFLDKIIMDYTGGTISAQSTENEGTELLVTTPIVATA